MSEQFPTDIDLEIIADSFRAISDLESWDRLVATWDRKIAIAGFGAHSLAGESQLREHYSSIGALLERVSLPSPVDPAEQAVSTLLEPAMAISDRFRVVAVNQAGREAFGVEQGQIAKLNWLREGDHRALRQFMANQAGGANQQYSVMRTRWPDGRDGIIEVFPVKVAGVASSFTVLRELTMRWSSFIDSVLVEAFGLTQAETDIARLLFVHADIAKVAAARGVSVRTTRLQLSNMYAKTETADQVELVRLLVLLAARLADKPEGNRLQWSDPLGRERILTRRNGLPLAYSVMGAQNGVPALFVHGIVNGYLYPEEFEATLEANGITLYVMSRPGAGSSRADPSLDPLTDHVEAIAHLCAELGLKGIAAAGIHASVIPLAVLAARADNPFRAIVAMGRFLPYSARLNAKIAMMPRTLLWLAVKAPWAAEIVGRQGWRALVQNGVDWYIERAYRDMPFDYETTRKAEITALMRNACAFTFQQGPEIFFDDLRMRSVDISPYVRALNIPFHWMLGREDVYSRGARFYEPQDVAGFIALNPRITQEDVAQACELMPYQRPELVAQRIVESAISSS